MITILKNMSVIEMFSIKKEMLIEILPEAGRVRLKSRSGSEIELVYEEGDKESAVEQLLDFSQCDVTGWCLQVERA